MKRALGFKDHFVRAENTFIKRERRKEIETNLFSSFNGVLNVCWNTHDSARNFAISPGSSESNVNVDVLHNSKSALILWLMSKYRSPSTPHTAQRTLKPQSAP